MVFLDAKFAAAVRAKSMKIEKTTQEMLAEAMNIALASHGRRAVFPVGHQRFMVRKKSVAVPRDARRTSQGRTGRASISGWFEKIDLNYATSVACELGLTLQELAETGLKQLMGRGAAAAAAAASVAKKKAKTA
jgi:hypothetical protein